VTFYWKLWDGQVALMVRLVMLANRFLRFASSSKATSQPSFQVALALTIKKQEAIKIEMEESLQPKEIKMIVPPATVKL